MYSIFFLPHEDLLSSATFIRKLLCHVYIRSRWWEEVDHALSRIRLLFMYSKLLLSFYRHLFTEKFTLHRAIGQKGGRGEAEDLLESKSSGTQFPTDIECPIPNSTL